MAKYKVGSRILDGNITLDQIFENCTNDLAVSVHPTKDEKDFVVDARLDLSQGSMLIPVFKQLLQYNKISAIKIVRILAGWNLSEAKEFIESL